MPSDFIVSYIHYYDSTLKKMKKENPNIEENKVIWVILRSWQKLSKEEQTKYKPIEKVTLRHFGGPNRPVFRSINIKK